MSRDLPGRSHQPLWRFRIRFARPGPFEVCSASTYWKMAVAQAAVLFLPFVDMLSLPLALNLGLVLTVLIIREGYIRRNDRQDSGEHKEPS